MNVLLVRPKSLSIIANSNIIDLEPLELEYLYTVAREEKVNCEILDSIFDKRNLKEVLISYDPDLVVISGYITQEQIIIAYSKIIKDHNSSIKIIVGGVHAEVNYNRFYVSTIDIISHSSSLEPFRKILKMGTIYDVSELANIDGICYRNNNEWTVNKNLSINPNDLPIPDRAHFNKNKHLYRYLGFSPCAIVKTAFSCPYNCSFCFCRKINDGKYIARDINLVVDEIEKIECECIHIIDDTFLIDRERISKFISLIKERNIVKKFIFYSRADFVVHNKDLISELSDIGAKGIIVGLEAIDDSTLNSYSKETSENINLQCVKTLKDNNIECLGLFIIDVNATKEDFNKLYKWVKRVKLNYASVSIFTPIPGTDDFEKYKNKLTTDKIEYWDFLHLVLEPTNMSRKAFYLEYYKLFMRLTIIGKKGGVYDFVDMKFIRNTAKEYFKNLIKS